MSGCISEKDIRARLNLQEDSLDVVRSVSLPGTYSDKITNLGRSLLGFTRLKHLDLSRNALESLKGLDHMKQLESINLYFNNITSLREVFRLRHNSKLKEVDLRLNPVTKSEPDYRLFVIHMLVNLRRLDDRSVRDSERKAALMHFDSDQAQMFADESDPVIRTPTDDPLSHTELRRRHVDSLASRPTALEDDTDKLLELIMENDNIMSQSQHRAGGPTPTRLNSTQLDEEYYHGPLNSPPLRNLTCSTVDHCGTESASKVQLGMLNELVLLLQEHVKDDVSTLLENPTFVGKFNVWLQVHSTKFAATTPQLHPTVPQDQELGKKGALREEVESLHKQIQEKDTLLLNMQANITYLQEELKQSQEEAIELSQQMQALTIKAEQLSQLHSSYEDMQQQLQAIHEQNVTLKLALDQVPTSSLVEGLHQQMSKLQSEKQALQTELSITFDRQKQDLANLTQVQELASMLQESHRSLVATNDHLLQELEEAKYRHNQDIMQMKENYEQLRKTIGLVRPRVT